MLQISGPLKEQYVLQASSLATALDSQEFILPSLAGSRGSHSIQNVSQLCYYYKIHGHGILRCHRSYTEGTVNSQLPLRLKEKS